MFPVQCSSSMAMGKLQDCFMASYCPMGHGLPMLFGVDVGVVFFSKVYLDLSNRR
jgi:hypothetical protein